MAHTCQPGTSFRADLAVSPARPAAAPCSPLTGRWPLTNLKPGNTIWLPSQNQWALIDFGCAVRTNSYAGLSFPLYYAPPEVFGAYKAGKTSIMADPSADVWALGVRCYGWHTGSMAWLHRRPVCLAMTAAVRGRAQCAHLPTGVLCTNERMHIQ
jgi:hypothetical protein